MSQSSIQTLNTVLDQAQTERDHAVRNWQQAQDERNAAQVVAQQLADYRRDYLQRWHSQFARQGTMDIVMCYQNFGSRLDEAISHQQAQIEQCQRRVDERLNELREREMRVSSVRKLIERRGLEMARVALRQEQKVTDEQAARSSWASPTSNATSAISGNGVAPIR